MMQPSTSTDTPRPLNQGQIGDTIPFDWKKYLDMRRRSLLMELGEVLRQLGYQPHTCPHCGGQLK